MVRSLSGRFLILTMLFIGIAETLILLPSLADFHQNYLKLRLDRAQIASLSLLSEVELPERVKDELLENAEVFNVVLRRNEVRQLVLSKPLPEPVTLNYDLRNNTRADAIRDALQLLLLPGNHVARVIGYPSREAGLMIEITMETEPMRRTMIEMGTRLLAVSAMICAVIATLLFFAVRRLILRPIKDLGLHMLDFAGAPDDARRILEPRNGISELREAEEALRQMEIQLNTLLKQKDRLAQLGEAVAKISHDLRNILTSAQLFVDRLEDSEDPAVRRLAPKLVNSITRAITLCETTLAFGRVQESQPRMSRFVLADTVAELIDAERLAVGEADVFFAEDVPATMTVRADSEQIYRVLSNLVRNARQAIIVTGKSGEIGISASESDEGWTIEVSDTGPGLPPKAREYLFKAFQGGVSKGGAGLGLTISNELVRGHGGQLELFETSDAGTVFRIFLPKGRLDRIDAEE